MTAIGHDPGVVFVPMFQDQLTLPDPSAVFATSPCALLGPLLYVTTIVHWAADSVETVTWPTLPRDTGLRTKTKLTETARRVGVGAVVGGDVRAGGAVVRFVRFGVDSCVETSVALAAD